MASRTLLTEIELPIHDGHLLPGSYAEVHLKLPGPTDTLRVPANALIFGADGMRVAAVTADHKVAMKSVTLGRDFGTEVEVLAGITPQDRLIVNPPDSIAQDTIVRLAPAKPGAGAPAEAKLP